MSAERRFYQIRIAERGADEVEGNVEFTLGLDTLHRIPVATGSLVHPLDGATEMRPYTVEAVDTEGHLIEAFAELGRWTVLGRMVDVRYRLAVGAVDDPIFAWTVYGTGRISGLDELDGPGKFRIQISDESWVSRRSTDAWGGVNTTSLWPAGHLWDWRGLFRLFFHARMTVTPEGPVGGSLWRVQLWQEIWSPRAGVVISDRASITQGLIRYIRSLERDDPYFGTDADGGGNWKHLKLWIFDDSAGPSDPDLPNPEQQYKGYDIVSFGDLNAETMYETLEEHMDLISGEDGSAVVTLTMWIRYDPVTPDAPPPTGRGFIWAPTAPPSRELPLLVGIDHASQKYGSDGGYLHPADFTRRLWARMGLRYHADSLDDLEADITFPAVAASVDDPDQDPERWMEENVWGPAGMLALKDPQGRRKLVDVRFNPDTDLESLPILNAENAKDHRWRLVGREMRNRISAITHRYGQGFVEPPERLDFFTTTDVPSEPYESDNIEFVGSRPYNLNARQFLEPSAGSVREGELIATGRGQPWSAVESSYLEGMLEVFQDGPVRYSGEVGKTLAETLSEGDLALIDETELKGANPATASRTGRVLVIILSLTRHPAHAEYEAMRVRGVLFPVFEEC